MLLIAETHSVPSAELRGVRSAETFEMVEAGGKDIRI